MPAWILVGFSVVLFMSGSLGGIVGAILVTNRPLLSEGVAGDAGVPPKKRGEVFGSMC
ncbi:MAG: hypothetical protein H0U91_08890 [Rubrobacter sp.]|jgi:hypothetical protein|nr:hypothetical protein [Rubrobacter sp.]MBA3951239.1 hypothetical protein [Rubrobacter sp.]MDQ3360807.1 hypothetical protein [Actinomycetota bacterium]MDQ3376653.1 hypothetical protein [Actinomycetota bacterium]